MSRHNTEASYGSAARHFHWLTALLIFTTFPLGLIAENMPFDTAEALARKAQLFSIHKTLGIATFAVALARILYALGQTRPAPLHPERRLETLTAEIVHWMLYISLVVVPLSGWIHHAAVEGFAPIYWPLGQGLPFVPVSEYVAKAASAVHWLSTKILLVAVGLHVAGALKHVVIDRDATLSRMTRGTVAGPQTAPHHSKAPSLIALLAYGALVAAAIAMTKAPETIAPNAAAPQAQAAGNWQVTEGQLNFTVRQMGSDVSGSFAIWSADITFDETAQNGKHGDVTVTIDTGSLTLGSVSQQAKEPEFFDVAQFPTATFKAEILPAASGYEAKGTLTLRGVEHPVTLPFTLTIEGDTAKMQGTTQLDRRDYAMGASYGDEATVGFGVTVSVDLTAKRAE